MKTKYIMNTSSLKCVRHVELKPKKSCYKNHFSCKLSDSTPKSYRRKEIFVLLLFFNYIWQMFKPPFIILVTI